LRAKGIFHEDLARAAMILPRGIMRRWLLPLYRRLPIPEPHLPAGFVLRVLPLPGTTATVRIIGADSRPVGEKRPVLLWMHGGGYVIGTARQDDLLCARYARELELTVVSVDYRLAPEHPWPAALDDCIAAYDLIQRDADALGVDAARVIVAGQSAGGGLAAATVLRLHDTGRRKPLLQLLVYPMLDDRTATLKDDGRPLRVWDHASNVIGWSSYLGRTPGSDDVTDHMAPARRVDVKGLPPTWIGVGNRDLFHDEDVEYARRLQVAKVPTTLEVVDGAFHGFDVVAPKSGVSRRFFASQVAAVTAALGR
jgi:acetyl esterase/lipase